MFDFVGAILLVILLFSAIITLGVFLILLMMNKEELMEDYRTYACIVTVSMILLYVMKMMGVMIA